MSADRPNWAPTGEDSTQTTCQNCGEPVLDGTARVFGDNQNRLWHCRECLSQRDLHNGAGFRPDYDPERDRGDSSEQLPVFSATEVATDD